MCFAGVAGGCMGVASAQENYFEPGRRELHQGCGQESGRALCDESAPVHQEIHYSEVCAWYGALQYAC